MTKNSYIQLRQKIKDEAAAANILFSSLKRYTEDRKLVERIHAKLVNNIGLTTEERLAAAVLVVTNMDNIESPVGRKVDDKVKFDVASKLADDKKLTPNEKTVACLCVILAAFDD